MNQDVYCCFERWVDATSPAPSGKSKSKSSKEPTPARFVGGGGITTGKLVAQGKRNSHKEKVSGKSKMHVWCVFDGHDMMGEVAAQIASHTFEQHLSQVRSAILDHHTRPVSLLASFSTLMRMSELVRSRSQVSGAKMPKARRGEKGEKRDPSVFLRFFFSPVAIPIWPPLHFSGHPIFF